MQRTPADGLMSIALAALVAAEGDPAFRTLADRLGGTPVDVRDRLIGIPFVRSRRLRFASGAELYLYDDVLTDIVLHTAPTEFSEGMIDASDWIPGVTNGATFADFRELFGASWKFSSGGRFYEVDGAYLEMTEHNGRFTGLLISAANLQARNAPWTEDCETCAELPRRLRGGDGGVDVGATVRNVVAAVAVGAMREDTHRVPLADLQLLHASGLVDHAESQASCRACGRVLCITLRTDAPNTVEYAQLGAARARPRRQIPPAELWGDDARVAAERDGMHYVDHEPEQWFLLEQQGDVFLDARYTYSALIDDSALIRLDDQERREYEAGGHAYLNDLAQRIHRSGPYREESPFYARNLYRAASDVDYRAAVAAALRRRDSTD